MLLRVPGLGKRAVDKIVAARRHTRLRLEDLARLSGAAAARPALPDRGRPSSGRARSTASTCAAGSSPPADADEPVLMRRQRRPRAAAPISTASAAPRRALVAGGRAADGRRLERRQRGALFAPRGPRATRRRCSLPRALGDHRSAEVVPHRDPERYALLYDLDLARDCTASASCSRSRATRSSHRLDADGRNRSGATSTRCTPICASGASATPDGEPERFAAWFEPDHFILEAATPFFVERFRAMRWTIVDADRVRRIGTATA